MYIISGCNIHNQWLTSEFILSNFPFNSKVNNKIIVSEAKLLVSSWAYNLFQTKTAFYITGKAFGQKRNLTEIKLPITYDSDLLLHGNDYKLYLINPKELETLWILNVEYLTSWKWRLKKINLNVEHSLLDEKNKKQKVETTITEVISKQQGLSLLLSDGRLYELPNKVKTDHCLGKVCSVQYGFEHGILLTESGTVYTWGNGRRCQLGHGDLDNLEEPTEVEALAGIKIVKIKAGGWHNLAISEYGDLYAWGWNDTGQLGIKEKEINGKKKSVTSCPLPTLVDVYNENDELMELNIMDIACGSRHSAITLEDNTVWVTGLNKYGQLGLCADSVKSLPYFKKIWSGANVLSLSSGPWCTIVQSDEVK